MTVGCMSCHGDACPNLSTISDLQKYYAPQGQPDRARTHDPPDHDSAFYVNEMPAVTPLPSVTLPDV